MGVGERVGKTLGRLALPSVVHKLNRYIGPGLAFYVICVKEKVEIEFLVKRVGELQRGRQAERGE